MGLETGTIFINDTGTGDLLEQIDYAINITYPKGRVYFDSLHGMNDLYPEWSSGYSQIEIYDAMNVLHKNGYQLVYEMENWTKSVQSQLTSRLLTPDLLSTVDIVVLQTPVVPYTNIEKNALEEFVINGGSILILGTRYQTMPIYSLNSLLTQLNTDITINGENIFDYIDVGFGYILDKYSVSEVDVNSPIFDTNNQFSYWYGATLETGSNADSIATLQNKTVVAAFDSQTGGRVVVWSDYHWLRNDIFSVTNPEEHEHILLNIFDYLNIQQEEDYILEATFNTTIQSSGNLECYVSLLDSSSNLPIPDRIYGDTLNASIISPDHIFTPLLINSLGTGIYSNASFSLGDSDYRPYTIQINVTASTGVITKEYQLYRINSTSQVEISNPTVSNFEITQQVGSSTLIRYIGNSPGLTSQLYGSLTTDSFYSDNAILEYEFSQTFPTIQHDYTYSISPIDHSGLFVFFAVASSPANHTNFEVTRSMVYVKNHDPEINEDDSFFNSIAFGDTREDDSLYILIVNNRNEIDLTVLAEEPVSYEDQTSELYAIVYYTAAASAGSTFDPLYPNSIPTSVLSYSDGQFEGQFKIPSSLSFTGDTGSVEISQQSHADYIYFSVLWITVRDTDGGSVDYLLLMSVNIVFDWDSLPDYLPVIFVILAILGITITIVTIIKKRRQKGTPQSQYYNNQTGYGRTYQAYCMHCGKQINSKYLVCPYCGKSLP